MSFQVGSKVLPKNPKVTTVVLTTENKEIGKIGDLPIVLGKWKKAKKMVWEGTITEAGKTMSQLETDYIVPLDALTHTVVTLTTPRTSYSGQWYFDTFEYREKGGMVRSWEFKMTFLKGSEYIVL